MRSAGSVNWSRRPLNRRPSRRPVYLLVLGGEQQRGDRFERGHQFVQLSRLEVFVRLRGEVVSERLDPLLDGATLFAEPSVVADEAATAHAVDHRGELRGREVV